MAYVRHSGQLIFTSSQDVIRYYTEAIGKFVTLQVDNTQSDSLLAQNETTSLRRQLVDQLKNFKPGKVDGYFRELMASAESDSEYYRLSHAYEALLMAELQAIKKKLHLLRTTWVCPFEITNLPKWLHCQYIHNHCETFFTVCFNDWTVTTGSDGSA